MIRLTGFIGIALLHLATFLSGAGVSLYAAQNHYQRVLADVASEAATTKAAEQAQALARLEDANRRGNELSARLDVTESALAQKTLEVSHAVARFTTGRPCLDGRAVRLLNQPTPDTPGAGPVPEAASAPDAADAATASDTDVAGWIAQAQHQYETCRARLDALIDFEEKGTP